jgi:hypothetical protein
MDEDIKQKNVLIPAGFEEAPRPAYTQTTPHPFYPLPGTFEAEASYQSLPRTTEMDENIKIPVGIGEFPPPEYTKTTLAYTIIDGKSITLLDSDNHNPQYSFSSNVFDDRGTILYDGSAAQNRLYDLTVTKDSARSVLIEGRAGRATFESLILYQEHKYDHRHGPISIHKPWKVVEKGQFSPLLELRLDEGQGLLYKIRHPSESHRRLLWHDVKGDVIAIEHRPGYSIAFKLRNSRDQAFMQYYPKYSKVDDIVQKPSLEILVELDEKMAGLLVAVWSARVLQETTYMFPLTMKPTIHGVSSYG